MTELLVTVDDVGISRDVNSAVRQLLESDSLDCLSIIPTGVEFEEAARIAADSDVLISVHLNCVQPPFITGVDLPSGHSAWFFSSARLADIVMDEWRAQIERVIQAGLLPHRLDSHQHIHNAPGLRGAILELADEYSIESVRTARLPDRWSSSEALLLDLMGRRLASRAAGAGISTSDFMLGFSVSGRVDREYLESMTPRIAGSSSAELVMHPSIRREWSLYQPEEYSLMLSDWFRAWRGSL
jgi:chitin disaccharide deacetylase